MFIILPLVILALTVVLLLISIACKRHPSRGFAIAAIGLIAAFCSTEQMSLLSHDVVGTLFVMDHFGQFMIRLILPATLGIAALIFSSSKDGAGPSEESYVALLLSALGACALVLSTHFISFFVSLELMTLPLYSLIYFADNKQLSLEAAVKYIVLAGLSAAFLLFGMVFLYAQTGTMTLADIFHQLASQNLSALHLGLFGVALIIVAMGFKLAVVPFHFWTPDVLQGAPLPIGAFLATVSKGAAIAVLFRFFVLSHMAYIPHVNQVLLTLAVVSMFVGNLLMLRQTNVKRILGYSSVAQVGYMQSMFVVLADSGQPALQFYLGAYFATSIAAFAALLLLSEDEERSTLQELRGLAYARPWVCGGLTVALLSLTGIPLTAGFMGKLWLLMAATQDSQWLILLSIVLSSVIGMCGYLKIIVALYTKRETALWLPTRHRVLGIGVLSGALLCLFWMGIFA